MCAGRGAATAACPDPARTVRPAEARAGARAPLRNGVPAGPHLLDFAALFEAWNHFGQGVPARAPDFQRRGNLAQTQWFTRLRQLREYVPFADLGGVSHVGNHSSRGGFPASGKPHGKFTGRATFFGEPCSIVKVSNRSRSFSDRLGRVPSTGHERGGTTWAAPFAFFLHGFGAHVFLKLINFKNGGRYSASGTDAGCCCVKQCSVPSPRTRSRHAIPMVWRSGKRRTSAVASAMRSFASLNVGTRTTRLAM